MLKEGEIVERGKHDDLISQNGVYQEMWEAQLRNDKEVSEPTPETENES